MKEDNRKKKKSHIQIKEFEKDISIYNESERESERDKDRKSNRR